MDGVVKGNDELWDHLFHGKPLKQEQAEQVPKEHPSKEQALKDQISKEQTFKYHALTNKVSKDPDEMKRIKSENAKLANQVTEIQTQLISQAIQVNNLSNKLMEAEEELVR